MISKIINIFNDSLDSFEGQRGGEKVILLIRKHVFIILLPLIIFGIGCILPVVLTTFLSDMLVTHGIWDLYIFLSSLWYSFLWLGIFHVLTMYTLNVVIVTNIRIIDSDQHGLFDRKVSEIHANRIQDVTAHTNGVIETLLNFGDVTVQSAASEKQFIFHEVSRPSSVREAIMRITSHHPTAPTADVE